jgi:hypothetical protein
MEIGCEDGMWMKLTQDHVQWQALVLTLLDLQILLLDTTCCEVEIYMSLTCETTAGAGVRRLMWM